MLDNPKTELKASIQVVSKVTQDSTAWGNFVVTPHPDVQCSVLDGEAVLLNLETGSYFTLNSVGTVAWELFNGERTLTHVHAAICERFDVGEDVARRDLLSLVSHLEQEGLIQGERR